jgi:hypothetical protein
VHHLPDLTDSEVSELSDFLKLLAEFTVFTKSIVITDIKSHAASN